MRLPFGIYNLINPERYIWLQVRILHETDKAILITTPSVIADKHSERSDRGRNVRGSAEPSGRGQSQNDNIKTWIPKSRIYGIRLRKNIFEIYIKDSLIEV